MGQVAECLGKQIQRANQSTGSTHRPGGQMDDHPPFSSLIGSVQKIYLISSIGREKREGKKEKAEDQDSVLPLFWASGLNIDSLPFN